MIDLLTNYWPALILVVEGVLSYTPNTWKTKSTIQLIWKVVQIVVKPLLLKKQGKF